LIFEPSASIDAPIINILMVLSRPDGEEEVPFHSVARSLLELFRPHRDRIHLEVLRPPTLPQLARALTDKPNFYHLLHFDGHGTFPHSSEPASSKAGTQGRLLFEDSDGRAVEVTGEELGGLLAG
jgi:hypothetical protein